MKIIMPAMAFVLLCAFGSCGKGSYKEDNKLVNSKEVSTTDIAGTQYSPQVDSTTPQHNEGENKKKPASQQPIPNPDWDKKIIKTATINFEVKNYNTFYAGLREKVRSLGGYVAQEEQSQSTFKIENVMVI